MRNVLAILALAFVATTVFQNQAHAQALLNLQGNVAVTCVLNSVDTTPYGAANTTLPIVAGTTSTPVANADVTCNNASGYSIAASSANGMSRLANTANPGTYYTTYAIEVTGTGSTGFAYLSAAPTTIKSTSLASPVSNDLAAINVRVDPITTPAAAGVYEDTVTFILTAN